MRTVTLAVVILCAAIVAMAQATLSPGIVSGIVLDPSGASAPEADVTLKQSGGKVVARARTGQQGDFRMEAVPPGNYVVEVQHEGFQRAVAQLRVSGKPLAPLKITLALDKVESEVSVDDADSAQVSSDVEGNQNAAAADQSLLQQIPVFDQDFVATMSAFLDSSAVGTSGTTLIVDGIEAHSVGVTASAIQEVRINQNPYSAEYARPGRGSIEVITKTAAAAYHGALNFIFRDSIFNARDPFALVRAPEQRRIFEGALSGPVGHSKSTSFLISGNRQEEDLQSTVFAVGLSGVIQQNLSSPKRSTQLSTRISHQFSPNHSASWQYNEWDYPSSNQGVGGFVLPEAATNSRQWEREFIFNDRRSFSPRWLSQFQALIGRERHENFSVNAAPKIVVQDAFTSGGAQQYRLEIENHGQLNEIVSWSAGKQLLKFGFNVPDWSRRGVDNRNNFGGTFYFSGLSEYAARQPYAYRQQQGSGRVVFWQKELGGFVQDEIRVRPNVSLALGLRYNWQNYLHDNKDFAPRIAFAYAPGGSRKTVIRGGAGTFYDRTGANPLADLLLLNGQRLKSYLITDPAYPNPFIGSALATDIVRFDPAIREAYTVQYSLGIERQIGKRTTASLTYTGARGIDLFRSRNINAPLGPDYLTRPDSNLGVLRQIESSGGQTSNSLELTVKGAVTRYFTGLVQYTFSRTENDTGGINWLPANQYDLSGEWGRADFDQRHRLNLLESFSPAKLFTLGIGITLATGKPYTLTTGQDFYRTGLANARPLGVARNTLEGPGLANLDLRWSRDFNWSKLKKDKGLVITPMLDAFNVFNRVNYSSPIGNQSSRFFGKSVSALPVRRLQLTIRMKF